MSSGEVFFAVVNQDYRLGGGGGTAVLKRAWQDLGGFDPKFTICWDLDFVLRLALQGWSFAYVPQVFFCHRFHGANLAKMEGDVRCVCEEAQVLFDAFHHTELLSPEWRSWLLAALRTRVVGAAYWQRYRQHYLAAFRFYRFALRHGIALPSTVTGMFKLVLAVCFQLIAA